jgi:hypothetical protein
MELALETGKPRALDTVLSVVVGIVEKSVQFVSRGVCLYN